MTAGLASDWQVTCLGRLIGPALAGPHLAGPALAGLLHRLDCRGRPVGRPQYHQVHWMPGPLAGWVA